jgi:oxygen-independent coproporphyrinogen III oxidase
MISSVYIHIPFCHSICTYCDFCKFIYNFEWVNDYLNKLELEIKDRYMDEVINTIYIGGGTPSCLKKEELDRLFNIIKIFKVSDNLEFTMECNLEDININFIKYIKEQGINRISIGVESFDKHNLEIMNRKMDYQLLEDTLNMIRDNGITNINLDLMYALPNENLKTVKTDLKKIVKLKPTHISTYSLILEDNTYLKYKNTHPINEELDYEMYNYICKYLTRHGYNHYEVSNFSIPNYQSKHNLVYWQNKEYYGFGCGASGYVSGVRYSNTRSLSKYIESDIFSTKELLSKDEIIDYHMILGLRLLKGINVNEFNNLYNVDMFTRYPINALIKYEDLIYKDGYIYINPSRIYVMNEILNKLV